jgi:hypothetical protein
MILVFGILSIVAVAVCGPAGLPFGIAAWVMGRADLKKMRANVMDPEGQGTTQAGWICGIIGTILDSLYVLGCLAYIGFLSAMFGLMRTAPRPATPVAPAPPPPPAPKKAAPAAFVPLRMRDYLPRNWC